MSNTTRERHTLSQVTLNALHQHTLAALERFADNLVHGRITAEQDAELRNALADDIDDVLDHCDPTRPDARVVWAFDWNDSGTDRERGRSARVRVIVLSADHSDQFCLTETRLRDLCLPDGRPVDSAATVRELAAQIDAQLTDEAITAMLDEAGHASD